MEASGCTPQGYLITETITGQLRTRIFSTSDDFTIVDGDGELYVVPGDAWILVVDRPDQDAHLVEKLLDTSERYLHGLWSRRPHHESTRTTFDIRTGAGGGRPEAADPPF